MASSTLAQRGGWEGCLAAAERAESEEDGGSGNNNVSKGGWNYNARELAVPKKHFFYRNAVGGATDRVHLLTDEVGERWVEDSSQGWKIPD